MASYPIPPWLQSQNPAPFFLQGVNQGADIAAQQNASDRAAATMQMQRAQMEQQQRMEAFNAAQKAVQLQMSVDEQRRQRELDQARLVGITQENQAKAQEMAGRMRFQQEFGKRVASGVDPSEALFQTLPMAPLSIAAPLLQRMQQNKTVADRQRRYSDDILSRRTGIRLYDDSGVEIPGARDKAMESAQNLSQTASVRKAEEYANDLKKQFPSITEKEVESEKQKLLGGGVQALNAPSKLQQDVLADDNAVRGIDQALAHIEKFNAKFGKNAFDEFTGPIEGRIQKLKSKYGNLNAEDEKLARQIVSEVAFLAQGFRKQNFGTALTGTEITKYNEILDTPESAAFLPTLNSFRGSLGDSIVRRIENWKYAPNIPEPVRTRYSNWKPGEWLGASEEQVPAPAQRKAGETYPTPRGRLKWTGTGWVKP